VNVVLLGFRTILAVTALAGLACAPGAGMLPAADYRDDLRTARSVSLRCPRARLAGCIRALSQAAGVSLSAGPQLADEPLVAGTPARPLRETMAALAELFEASWTTVPGSPAGYRLDVHPSVIGKQATARAAFLKHQRVALDQMAAETVRDLRAGNAPRPGAMQQEAFALLLWSYLPPADRERVLGGAPVSFPIPEAGAQPVLEQMVAIAAKPAARVTGPLLATYDLDDPEDTGLPQLRARATARREDSIVAAIGMVDWLPPLPAAPPLAGADAGPTLPASAGARGRLAGTPDELIQALSDAIGASVFSRQRALAGTFSVVAGGRTAGAVAAEVAGMCGVTVTVSARGSYLFRSQTALLDLSARPAGGVVRSYLEHRPSAGKPVPLALLSSLAELTPLQLATLRRSNLCTPEARFAADGPALLAFVRALAPDQRRALFGTGGLEVASLTHAQLHALLDARVKRAGFDVFEQMQRLRGLRFRLQENLEHSPYVLTLEALRGDAVVARRELTLPVVGLEEEPSARRGE
jgi:hypothetical protein